MSPSLLSACVSLREALAGFEPGLFSAADCGRLAEELAITEKACVAARLLAASRAVDGGVHRDRGFKDGAAWLARHSGTTGAAARQALDTANRLGECNDTKNAFLAGDISLAQASEITQAQEETPGAEAELLPVARGGDLSKVRERAREHRQAQTPVAELHRQQQAARFFKHWRDRLGMVCFSGALPPETGLPFVRRVELATARTRREARRDAGKRTEERWEAHAADALAALTATGAGAGKRSDHTELVVVCDLLAWRRGHAHPGEPCHLIDGGPIPVELAKALAADAFVSAVLHDGVDIQRVKRFGRYIPAELRTALDLGPVPEFSGRECVDCGSKWGLEYDHVDPVANQGPTTYGNVKARCWKDHQIKTERDRKAGLLGPRPPNSP